MFERVAEYVVKLLSSMPYDVIGATRPVFWIGIVPYTVIFAPGSSFESQ